MIRLKTRRSGISTQENHSKIRIEIDDTSLDSNDPEINLRNRPCSRRTCRSKHTDYRALAGKKKSDSKTDEDELTNGFSSIPQLDIYDHVQLKSMEIRLGHVSFLEDLPEYKEGRVICDPVYLNNSSATKSTSSNLTVSSPTVSSSTDVIVTPRRRQKRPINSNTPTAYLDTPSVKKRGRYKRCASVSVSKSKNIRGTPQSGMKKLKPKRRKTLNSVVKISPFDSSFDISSEEDDLEVYNSKIRTLLPILPSEKDENVPIGSDIYYYETDSLPLKDNTTYNRLQKAYCNTLLARNRTFEQRTHYEKLFEMLEKDARGFFSQVAQKKIDFPRSIRPCPNLDVDWSAFNSPDYDPSADYTIEVKTKSSSDLAEPTTEIHSNSSYWTSNEHEKLLELLQYYPIGNNKMESYRKIASHLQNRSAKQVQSRVERYYIYLAKNKLVVSGQTQRYKRYLSRKRLGPKLRRKSHHASKKKSTFEVSKSHHLIDEDSFMHSVVSSLNHELAIDDSSDSSSSATCTADEVTQSNHQQEQDGVREGCLDEQRLLRCLQRRRKSLKQSQKSSYHPNSSDDDQESDQEDTHTKIVTERCKTSKRSLNHLSSSNNLASVKSKDLCNDRSQQIINAIITDESHSLVPTPAVQLPSP